MKLKKRFIDFMINKGLTIGFPKLFEAIQIKLFEGPVNWHNRRYTIGIFRIKWIKELNCMGTCYWKWVPFGEKKGGRQ
jgi:hypothetical protein